MITLSLYVNVSEYQKFEIISDYDETSTKTPFGYHFVDNQWANVYNSSDNKVVGKIVTQNNYHSISSTNIGGYCNNNNVIYIENEELNRGSMEFVYNFYSTTDTTNINPDIPVYPTFCSGTDYYYLKKIDSIFTITNNLLNIVIYIKPTIYPSIITNNVNIYWKANEKQTFRNICNDSLENIQFGYSFNDLAWSSIYNLATNNKIGYAIIYNTFVSVNNNRSGGYCKINVTISIDSELPIGTIEHTYTFLNPNTNTNYIKGTTFNTTVVCATGEYNGKNIISTVYVDPFLTRFNSFTILV